MWKWKGFSLLNRFSSAGTLHGIPVCIPVGSSAGNPVRRRGGEPATGEGMGGIVREAFPEVTHEGIRVPDSAGVSLSREGRDICAGRTLDRVSWGRGCRVRFISDRGPCPRLASHLRP
ncbi:MAG: hypothetical protein D6795_16295 [Deltaproteobacteria bacterium]|nr:MAG: hypothetical protein D6795_16295 [Deltaproteobacteria bacterium]